MPNHYRYEADFFTATNLNWKRLLKPAKYKDIIVNSLRYLSEDNRVAVHGFVIMDNHLHLIWQIRHPFKLADVQRSFLRYTAQQIKFDLVAHHPAVLEHFFVGAKDRQYQFWERNPLSVPLWTTAVLEQKLVYLHANPVRAGLCARPEDYHYSSAGFYTSGNGDFDFLVDYRNV